MLRKTILVDPASCLQCSNCWVACKDEHCDNDWSPIAAVQGDGQWWIRVEETEAASGHHMKLHRVPIMCQQCEDAPCIAAGDGAVTRRDDGIVLIDPEKARGNRNLVDSCPYGAIFWNDELQVAQKCTMCAHLLDAGYERPRCVAACPNDALTFVDIDDLTFDKITAPLETLHPEFGTSPGVKYINLPKLFVAGECASADLADCVEDCEITATHQVTGREYIGWSGTLGDFHIDVDEPGYYTLMFKAPGYKRKFIRNLEVHESLSVDVVKLPRMSGGLTVSSVGATVIPAMKDNDDEEFEFVDPRTPYPSILRSPLGDKEGVFKIQIDGGNVSGCLSMDGNDTEVSGSVADDGKIEFDTQVNTPLGCLDAHLSGRVDERGLWGDCTTKIASFVVFPEGEEGPDADQHDIDGHDHPSDAHPDDDTPASADLTTENDEKEGVEMTFDKEFACSLTSPLGTVDSVVRFNIEGDAITGEFVVDQGTHSIENGTINGNAVEFDSQVESPAGAFPAHVTGAFEDDEFTATASTPVAEFTITPRA